MGAHAVGVQPEALGQLLGRCRATQLAEQGEQPRTRRLGQGITRSARDIHAASFAKLSNKNEQALGV